MPSDAQTIIWLNIEHYEALLRSELDDAKRAMVTRLLKEERQKLEALQKRHPSSDEPNPA